MFAGLRIFTRGFRAHICDDKIYSFGRSIIVRNQNVTSVFPLHRLINPQAYSQLKNVLVESKLRETVKYQERFERPTDKRKRKKNEGIYNRFLDYKRRQIRKAYALNDKEKIDAENYVQI
jgi:ribosomal protein S21